MTISSAEYKVRKSVAGPLTSLLEYAWNAIVAIILLLTTFPVLIWIYLKLKKSGTKNPLFAQCRVGKNGREFTIYKFRTMVDDATKDGPFICTDYQDSRITEFGRFLRQKKLDELPQLINILKGDMNFVGPRPEIPHFHQFNTENILRWEERLQVKPGITGLAQIDRIVSHNPAEKIVLDLEYISHKSFLYDWEVMFKTVYYWFSNKYL